MASSLRAVSRLVTNTHKPLATGASSEIRKFGTTGILRKSNYADIEHKRGSLYHLIWKRKFTWLIVFGGFGALLFEVLHPDKKARTEAMINDWKHKSGGAYDPMKPQKENPVATPKTE